MNVIKGKSYPPARLVVFGPPGVGKSSFACGAPDTIALDYESGLSEIGVDRVRGPATWAASLALVRELCEADHAYRTIVIDTIDRLEDQATEDVCKAGKKASLADFGYGDGYEAVAARWREILFALESARARGREVVLVAHVQQKIQDDPMLGKYDKLVAALGKRCWSATHRWADAVLFAQYEAGLIEGRAIMTGSRVLYTSAATGFDAKNRWGLPRVLPLSWESFDAARKSLCRSASDIIQSVRALETPETKDLAEKYIVEANGDVPRLVAVETSLRKKVTA